MSSTTSQGMGSDGSARRVFDAQSPYVLALGVLMSRLESTERKKRELDAERSAILSAVYQLAVPESDGLGADTPSGKSGELAYRAVRAEVAMVLGVGERAVDRQLSQAELLHRAYPMVSEAVADARISYRHAEVILDAGNVIGSGDDSSSVVHRADYENAVLAFAVEETPSRLKPIARRLAEQFTEVSLDDRHADARKRRRVTVCEQDDGMADLIAHLPAAEAYAIYDRLTRMSRALEKVSASPETTSELESAQRSRDELRADILTDLVLCGKPSEGFAAVAAVRAQVQVVVHESAFKDQAGQNSEDVPPILEGYGPIDNASARWLLGSADFWDVVRVGQDLARGNANQEDIAQILSVNRYRPSEQMRRLLRVRDQRCRFQGCQVPASRCDLDHTIDAALGGPTATDNLAHLCRGDHVLKHNSGWQVTHRKEGELTWISPTGRIRKSSPPSRVMFTAAVSSSDEPF